MTTEKPRIIEKINNKISSLQDRKKNHLFTEKLNEERQAIRKIKTDPKFFFKYSKRFQKLPYSPNILINSDNEVISDPKTIADELQKQFQSVFSQPLHHEDIKIPFEKLTPKYPLPQEISLTKEDIITAINEMKNSSSCPKNEIPSIIFKTYKDVLWEPLLKFWTKSFDTGEIPQQYKKQTIIPIPKTDPKTNPENFRPIAITLDPI